MPDSGISTGNPRLNNSSRWVLTGAQDEHDGGIDGEDVRL